MKSPMNLTSNLIGRSHIGLGENSGSGKISLELKHFSLAGLSWLELIVEAYKIDLRLITGGLGWFRVMLFEFDNFLNCGTEILWA